MLDGGMPQEEFDKFVADLTRLFDLRLEEHVSGVGSATACVTTSTIALAHLHVPLSQDFGSRVHPKIIAALLTSIHLCTLVRPLRYAQPS